MPRHWSRRSTRSRISRHGITEVNYPAILLYEFHNLRHANDIDRGVESGQDELLQTDDDYQLRELVSAGDEDLDLETRQAGGSATERWSCITETQPSHGGLLSGSVAITGSILIASALTTIATSLAVNTVKHWPVYADLPSLLSVLYPLISLNQLITMLSTVRYTTQNRDTRHSNVWGRFIVPLMQSIAGTILLSALALIHRYFHTLWSITIQQVVLLSASSLVTSTTVVLSLDAVLHVCIRHWPKSPPRLPAVEFFFMPIVASLACLSTCLVLPAVGYIFVDLLQTGPASCVAILYHLTLPGLLWFAYRKVPAADRNGWPGAFLPLAIWCAISIGIDSNLWVFNGRLNRLLTVISCPMISAVMIHFNVLHTSNSNTNSRNAAEQADSGVAGICCNSYIGSGPPVLVARIGLIFYPLLLCVILLGLRTVEDNVTPLSFTACSMLASHGFLLYIGQTVNRIFLNSTRPAIKKLGAAWILPNTWLLFERLAVLMNFAMIFLVDNIIRQASAWTVAVIID